MLRALSVAFLVTSLAVASDAEQRVSFRGIGQVRIGVSFDQLQRDVGHPIAVSEDYEDASCYYVHVNGYDVMIADGLVSRIDVWERGIKTDRGAQVGDSIAAVQAMYGRALKKAPRFYGGLPDLYLTQWSADRMYAVRFETENGKVARYYIGRAQQVQYVEGCE
jgi:hypothetical protein